jgi:multicomponent Na+:H+ antiporter subunit C
MSQFQIYAITSVVLFCIGFYGLIALPHLLRKILGFNVMGIGVFLFLVTLATRGPGSEPDPVPQAMVLTGIVVAVSATAFALTLARRIHAETGRAELSRLEGDDPG